MDLSLIAIGYLIIVNVLSYSVMGIDKQRARKGEWRIPENTIWMLSIIGGSIGSVLGMNVFRHKTKKLRFKFGLPFILIVHLFLLAFNL
ncbi:DUF1294 domain-containing protein [Aquibacillus sediminis]|uniref:DUF1294 domain-containing protein n=1 Tax=Aquibacillus sediminis TaxID=2574734 RepID=UPI0011093659|nr:DUF1294 domain-containing protein [Aquibacillus sediminis]